MSDSVPKIPILKLLADLLRGPVRLRLILCTALLACWYFGYYSSLADRIASTTAVIDKERRRVTTAREIEGLRKSLALYRDRVPPNSAQNDLIRYLLDHFRPTPLRLSDLKPEKAKDLGPFESIMLHLTFEGSFVDLSAFLGWVQSDRRLMRVDTLSISPVTKDQAKLAIQLTMRGLMEKETPRVSDKPGKS